MKTIAKITLKVADKPKFDVLIELNGSSRQERQKITEILESSGYQDFKILNDIYFSADKIIFQSDKTPRTALENIGYSTRNLWHIADVQSKFDCEDGQAFEVLESVFSNECHYTNTWEMIDIIGNEMGLKEK